MCTVHEKAGESQENIRTNDDIVSLRRKTIVAISRTMIEMREDYNAMGRVLNYN